jgi:hypothetical protein
MKKTPSKVAHNQPKFFFITGPAAQMARLPKWPKNRNLVPPIAGLGI